MKFDVTIYGFLEVEDAEHPLADRQVKLTCLAVVPVESYDDRFERICATAWVESVGRARHDLLVDLGAPEVLLKEEINVEQIADKLVPAPAGLGPLNAYLLDNRVDSWLLCVSWEESDCDTMRLAYWPRSGRPPHSIPNSAASVLHSLRYPRLN